MAVTKARPLTRQDYATAAMEYQSRLTLENLMEATPQAKQREITVESLALVSARRPDVQVFNELLVQYPQAATDELGQVVPDNMIVVSTEPSQAEGSFDLTLEPAPPYCVLEYVSPNSRRKDYTVNMVKYERGLKVPYYLRFDPERQALTVFRHNKRKFVAVKPNTQGRLALKELDLEVALLDGWVRYWYQGELLMLPADLQRSLDESRRQLIEKERQLTEKDRQLTEKDKQLTEKDRQLTEERQERAKERRASLAAEEELARLRAQIADSQRPKPNGS